MERVTIATESENVISLFGLLRNLTPETNDPTHDVEDQLGRFNIFARNLGIFADGHGSLDWRLRESEDAQEVTLRLLRSLQWFLRRAIDSAKGLTENTNSDSYLSTLQNIGDETSSMSVGSLTSVDTSAASTDDTLETSEPSPVTDHLSGVEETIDRLYRLSWIIRTASIASQNIKAISFPITDDEGNDCEAAFEEYARKIVKRRCPVASEELTSKIVRSITVRRKRFLYRRSHQDKLGFRPTEAGIRETTSSSRTPGARSTITTSQNESKRHAPSLPDGKSARAKGMLPSATSASDFRSNQFHRDIVLQSKSVISTALYSPDDRAEAFQPPPPPKLIPGSKEFECPYCYIMMPIKEAKPAQWKQHFLRDLDPFVCIYPQCPEPELMFSDIPSWLSHMAYGHARQWCCSTPGHATQSFASEEAFESHMWSSHPGAFTESHLPRLKRRAEVPGVAFFECPFCTEGPQTEAGVCSDELVRHVANHLRLLATISLPIEHTRKGAESEGTASHKANESSDADEHVLESLSSLSTDPDTSSLHKKTNQALQLEDPDPEPDTHSTVSNVEAEWGFIEAIPYHGPDRDPVLQTFLRKLYLESSPSMSAMKGLNLPCFVVPFERNRNFFGREYALSKAADALLPSMVASNPALMDSYSNPKTFAIYGPGGMGKTQVAVEFVHRHRSDFDVVIWSHADDTSKLAKDFNTTALKLGLVADGTVEARDQNYTRDLVKRWLVDPLKDLKDKDSERASWLLIYDSVDDSSIINDFWPYDGPGSILITSRDPFAWMKPLSLLPFSTSEATDYLLSLTRREKSSEARGNVEDVSQKLGGLPLALTQMAGIISRHRMTFAQFAQAYNERESRHAMLQTVPNPELSVPWYEHSVASVWALETLRHARTLLNACSMLDPDGISERIFTENFGLVNLFGLPSSILEYQQAKSELLGMSIISMEKSGDKLFVHRLVQDVARTRLNPLDFRDTFMACVHLVSKLWKFEDFTWRHGTGRWAICEELFPHILRFRELAAQNQLFPSNYDCDGDFAFARLLTDAGWYHHERGRSADAQWFNDVAEHICETWRDRLEVQTQPLDDRQDKIQRIYATLAEITHNRGCIVTETNQAELAFRYFESFNVQMTKEFEARPELVKTDMRLAISWNELGNAHMLNKQWVQGEKCFQCSIATMRLLNNFVKSHISLPIVNMGLSCWLQGRHSEALEILMQGLKAREDAFGVDDRISFITGRYLHAVGNVMASMGDQQQSLEYHRRALFHYKSTLGNNHHRTADLFVKVAEHSMRMRQEENALALLDHALKAYNDRNTGDPDTSYIPEKARAVFKRSRALRLMKKFDEAEVELKTAASLREQIVGEDGRCNSEMLKDADFDDLIAFWSR